MRFALSSIYVMVDILESLRNVLSFYLYKTATEQKVETMFILHVLQRNQHPRVFIHRSTLWRKECWESVSSCS